MNHMNHMSYVSYYKCQNGSCKNEIIPCLHGNNCNQCKHNLIRKTDNNIKKCLPNELIDMICKYINNDKEESLTCIYCRKVICYACFSCFNTPWCCSCYIGF